MKILIEIDDNLYKDVKKYTNRYRSLGEAVANGKPLPKGHGRLIDADTLVDGFEDNYEFCEALNATPTIIEADKNEIHFSRLKS